MLSFILRLYVVTQSEMSDNRKRSFDSSSSETRIAREDGHLEDTSPLGRRLHIHYQVEEIQRDATICRYLFTAKLLYMFRASIAPIISST